MWKGECLLPVQIAVQVEIAAAAAAAAAWIVFPLLDASPLQKQEGGLCHQQGVGIPEIFQKLFAARWGEIWRGESPLAVRTLAVRTKVGGKMAAAAAAAAVAAAQIQTQKVM